MSQFRMNEVGEVQRCCTFRKCLDFSLGCIYKYLVNKNICFNGFHKLLAIEFTLEHPEMVTSLTLAGPIVSGFAFTEHFSTRGGRGMPSRDAPVDRKIEYWTAKDPWVMAPENAGPRETMRKLMVENPQDLTGSGSFARCPGWTVTDRLSEIAAPTLIIVGESDIPDVHTHAGVIQVGIKGSRRVVLTDSGHLAPIEKPDELNRLVLDFLGSTESL